MRQLSNATIAGLWAVLLSLSIILACGGAADPEDYEGSVGSGDGSGADAGDGTGGSGSEEPTTDVEAVRDQVVAETNDRRAFEQDCGNYGVFAPAPALQRDGLLDQAAQRHADDMARGSFFSHTGSDGTEFDDRIYATGYSGVAKGENIAAGQLTAAQVVGDWLDSDSHCWALMMSDTTRIGVGYAEGGAHGRYWVQVFAR